MYEGLRRITEYRQPQCGQNLRDAPLPPALCDRNDVNMWETCMHIADRVGDCGSMHVVDIVTFVGESGKGN